MPNRLHFRQSAPFKERLAAWAADVRAEAARLEPGIAQDLLLTRARQADTAAHLDDWANSCGLRPPR